jgi:uncharacterized protein
MLLIREKDDGITIECRVTPRAGRTEIKGERDGVLQVALNAPPIEGRANEAVIRVIAKALGIPHSRISILKGAHDRRKVLFLSGVAPAHARSLLTR